MDTTQAATNLRTITKSWPLLADALTTAAPTGWPPTMGTAALLADRDDPELAVPAGQPPIRVAIVDAEHSITELLVDTADVIAADIQRDPISRAPRDWPPADRARRDALAAEDAANPRRWRFTGTRTAPHAATWLHNRLVSLPGGPFRPLALHHVRHVVTAAQKAAQQLERALGHARLTTEVDTPCPDCTGRIRLHGGDGTPPAARCHDCGRTWTHHDTAA